MRTWIAVVALVGCGDVGSQDRDAQVIHIDAAPEDGAGPTQDSYAAFALPGGLDRIVIVKTRLGTDTCFGITLRSPAQVPPPGLELPMGWDVEVAQALRPAAACNPGYDGPVLDGAEAKAFSGTIDWQAPSIPAVINKVDAMLLFDMPPPAFPPSEHLDTSNLPTF